MKTISIILLDTVKDLGNIGDVIEVNDGYARNFLFRKNLAKPMTKGSLEDWKKNQERLRKKKENAKQDAIDTKVEIENKYTLTLHEKAGKEGKLFGSITSDVIAKHLQEDLKMDVDKKKITIEKPIKTLGHHIVGLKLYPEVTAEVKIIVKAIEE